MKNKITLLLIFFLFSTIGLYAQTSRIHAGVAFPTGDFIDDAATGFTVGYRYYSHLTTPGLSLGLALDFFYNGIDNDIKDRREQANSNYDLTHPKFLNLPAMAIANYTHSVNENFGFFGEAGLGLNLSMVTPEKYDRKSSTYESKYTYTPTVNVCFGLEGGIMLQEKFTFSLRYNSLGNYKYRYKRTIKSDGSKTTEKGKVSRIPINHLALVLGYRF